MIEIMMTVVNRQRAVRTTDEMIMADILEAMLDAGMLPPSDVSDTTDIDNHVWNDPT